jgi:hypothetical protein
MNIRWRVFLAYATLIVVPALWDVIFAQRSIPIIPSSYDRALEAIKLLKEWSIWLAGIQSGAIAAIGALLKDGRPTKYKWLLPACLSAFCLSLLSAAWLLGTLPRLLLLLTQDISIKNDFIARVIPFYLLPPHIVIPVRIGLMITYEHIFFLVGIALFCWMLLDWRKAGGAR